MTNTNPPIIPTNHLNISEGISDIAIIKKELDDEIDSIQLDLRANFSPMYTKTFEMKEKLESYLLRINECENKIKFILKAHIHVKNISNTDYSIINSKFANLKSEIVLLSKMYDISILLKKNK